MLLLFESRVAAVKTVTASRNMDGPLNRCCDVGFGHRKRPQSHKTLL